MQWYALALYSARPRRHRGACGEARDRPKRLALLEQRLQGHQTDVFLNDTWRAFFHDPATRTDGRATSR
jgi:hypothetical protein